MRALIGLASLVASVSAQTVSWSGTQTASFAPEPPVGQTALAQSISVFLNQNNGPAAPVTPGIDNRGGLGVNSGNYAMTVASTVSTVVFSFTTNQYTAQMQYRWSPNYPNPMLAFPNANLSPTSYLCDVCALGTAISCNTSTGPGSGSSPAAGFACASLSNRVYTFSGLVSTPTINSFAVQLLDRNTAPGPNTSSYSFQITVSAPAIHGDPEILGLQGQDFQVHGVPDEIFNMISYPSLQVNARFSYLSSGLCIDNYTTCFAHPGTYISEEGIRLGHDKIHVRAGSAKKGLSVSINGQKLASGKQTVKLGSVELVNHRRVVIKTPIMTVQLSNSDKFLNQESVLHDVKLLALGAERRTLATNEHFHAEVPLHGLQGQTWRNVEYASGLEYEGSISDYQVQDGNLFGSSFVFNKFQQ